MALDLGELTIALEVENNLGRGLAEAKREVSSLPPHVQQEMSKVTAEMDRAGKAGGEALANGLTRDAGGRLRNARGQFASDAEIALAGIDPVAERRGSESGGVLAQGMRSGLIRNSPLIVAAVGGALAAGAPVAMAGATALFAGIGIVAAAQSERVQSAWLGTWENIRDGAIAEARPIEATLVGLAARVESRFQDMRPVLGSIFADAAPQIDVFADGILGLAENALPGFQRAVAASMPVTQGFADFLAKTGTGLTGFFDSITAHAPAASAVWSSLGDSMAELLPLLGELLGQGAELAATVLPMLSGSLGVVLDIVSALGPALPLVAAGFGAWKIAGTVGPLLDRLAGSLGKAAESGGMFAGTAGRASTAMGGLSAATIPVAAGVAAWAVIFQHSESQIRDWAAALNEGGDAARQAQEDMAGFDDNMGKVGVVLDTVAAKTNVLTASTAWAFSLLKNDTDEAREAHEKYLASLTPIEAAARNVAIAEEALANAIGKHGENSPQAQAAQERLTAAERTATDVADQHARAITGVTEAMAAQADQARARVDANFAYERSVNGVEDAATALAEAQAHLNDADENTRTSMEDVQRAALGLNEAYSAQVAAAQQLATSQLPAAMDEQQKAIIGAKAALDELNGLVAAGVVLPPSMEQYRQQLISITGEADGAALAQAQLVAALGEIGVAVTAIPGTKAVKIDAPTEDVKARLLDLGFYIQEMPDGSIEVRAVTEEAKANLGNLSGLVTELDAARPTPVAGLDASPLLGNKALADAAMQQLGGQRPTPIAGLDRGPLEAGVAASGERLSFLDGSRPTPIADLADDPLVGAYLNDMGLLGDLSGQRPTPVAALNDGPFQGTAANDFGVIGQLAGQRPTPSAFLNDGPFRGTAASVLGGLGALAGQRPTPSVFLNDQASGGIGAITRGINSIPNRTVTVTVQQRIAGGATVNSLGLAGGGNIGKALRGFAPGGSPQRRSDGRLVGPGGPLDDLIPAITNMGEAIRVANDEWIVPGAVGYKQGDRKMAALIAGRASIVMPEDWAKIRSYATGGELGAPPAAAPTTATWQDPPGAVVINGGLTVKIETPLNLMHDRDLDRAAQMIERKLVDLARRRS